MTTILKDNPTCQQYSLKLKDKCNEEQIIHG